MGGMFDPVHEGHLAAARLAQTALALDCVHLVPCARPNHRGQAGASGADRLAMLQLATAGEPSLLVDDRELQRPGISFMVDTLSSFVEQYPAASLVYILGRDSFETLPGWHRWLDLLDLCHLAVVSRPRASSSHAQPAGLPAVLADQLAQRQVDSAGALFRHARGKVLMLDALDMPVSSTSLRHALAQIDAPAEIPSAVLAYIRQHGLYVS